MEQQLFILAALAMGLILGSVTVWLILRGRVATIEVQARSESQVDLARLHERLAGSQGEIGRVAARYAELEDHASTWRDQLNGARDERSQLAERASRVEGLERDLATRTGEFIAAQEESTRFATQLGERSDALQAHQRRLLELENDRKTDREKIDALQMRLQEESNNAAGLSEQNARLPELTKAYEAATREVGQLKQNLSDLREKLGAAESTVASQIEHMATLQLEKSKLAELRDRLTTEQQRLSTQVAELTTTLESERTQTGEKLQLLKDAEEQLSNRFKTLANEILEDKSKRFTDQNQTNLNQLLEPLKVKITEFQGKVQEVYVQEGKDRSALAEQVKQLMVLNNQLSDDAHNLTRALKGQAKTQGNWGELILERVLETSGLRKGHEYDVQESHTRDDGSRAQPDVVIHLPEDRHLIVDAKVSLIAYEEHANSETDLERNTALKRHLDSVRTHIRGLSEKNYQHLYGVQSLDFVLMFVPVEPAFMLAISHDSDLWQEALKKNVLLVSPSTLLFVVRTVAHLWRQEQQSRNAQDIARRGAELYDKLVGFVGDLDDLGKHLTKAQSAYGDAYGKLKSGRGNLIGQAQKLVSLGIKPAKQLPQNLIDAATDVDESLPLLSIINPPKEA